MKERNNAMPSNSFVVVPCRGAVFANALRSMLAFSLALLAAAWSEAATAQAYPARPLKLIVAFAPGGPPDIAARIMAQKLSEGLGQQVVVENRPGVGGTLGAAAVAKAPPDGYTMLLATTGTLTVAPNIFKNPGYDPHKSFAPIGRIGIAPFVIVINSSFPARTLKEFSDVARSRPGQINYASSGNGAPPHIVAEMFKVMSGLNLTHVAYKGTAAAVTGLLAGDVQVYFDQYSPLAPHVSAGKLRLLAVASTERQARIPDVPTSAEAGLPGFEMSAWTGLVAPRGTPTAIVARLHAEMTKALESKEVRDTLARLGTEPAGMTPLEFTAFIDREIEKWSRAVKASGAKID